ncbi:hypothetical protein NQ315_004719 [Exocentrus adspersus]|uniref:Uncharacterized protein n=1 Tax=Exocentrus adspersus TaxID=1586481 RepID=A0AAV8W2L4_9CUCU|nr:hypothetical protein NQ315_004719 [Exocentrus adspersus]
MHTAPHSHAKSACNCDEDGSKNQTCNSTGACLCKPNYTGHTCNTCKDGYWKNNDNDCVKCICNKQGSLPNTYCNKKSGKCYCQPGVAGNRCDRCKPGHYGTIEKGCKECDPCNKVGHICDPETGKCVCPTLTSGDDCRRCAENAWGYRRGIGCKACECSETGSVNLQCDRLQGRCNCKPGYEGEKCNKCTFAYSGYPYCKKCNCNLLGTVGIACNGDDCDCTSQGSCRCKDNVQGLKCDTCKPRTFGLTKGNPKGCTSCFCFGRSDECTDSNFNWDKIRAGKINNETEVVSTDNWKLPSKFLGDLTASYDGYLTVDTKNGYFQVILEGNGVRLQSSGSNEIQFVENNWNIAARNTRFPQDCQTYLSRSCFMVILQNVTSILIEANAMIREVLLDKAKPNIPTYSPSQSVEKCECPKEYTGLSCQDPNVGYFRYFPNNPTKDKWIDVVVGKSKRCECNGRSNICDPNTGFCKNCTENTAGEYCELCDVGFYEDSRGKCSPCLCPTASQNNADNCSPIKNSFICNCKQGYKGQFCEKCADGYFNKNPGRDSILCQPCNCNYFGTIISNNQLICNEIGKCQCKEGFKGEKCDECVNEREFIKNGICTPCDECTKLLFTEIDKLENAVEDTFGLFENGVAPPWKVLTTTIEKHDMLTDKFKNKRDKIENLLDKAKIEQLEKKINKIQKKMKKQHKLANQNVLDTDKLRNSSNSVVEKITELNNKLINIIQSLQTPEAKPVNVKTALERAKDILKGIERISKKFNEQEDEEAFKFYTKVTQKINDLYTPSQNIPTQLLNDLKNKLQDLINLTRYVEDISNKAEAKNLENEARITELKEKIETIRKGKEDVEDSVKNIIAKINATNELVHQLEVVYEDLKRISDLSEIKELEHRIRRQMEEKPEMEELLSQVVDHVEELKTKINSYRSIFNFTKDEWNKINASGAYEALLNGIKEARETVGLSRKILENATKLMNPTDSDNISDRSKLAKAYSDGLNERIKNLQDVSKSLTDIKNKLDRFKYSILKNGETNNDLNQILDKMESEVTSQEDRVSKLEEAIENNTAISEDMEKIKKRVGDMLTSDQENFFKKYGEYLNLTSKEEINKLKLKLEDTRKHIESIDISSTHFDTIKNFNAKNKDKNLQVIRDKIEKLKNKIYYAKQAADTISIAMNISNCRMSYYLPETVVFQSLSITFKCKTCQLFKVSNDDGELSLKVNNYNILLKFADKNILISDNADDKEKTVNIEKLGSLIKMQIGTTEKSEVINSPYYIIHPQDKIEIGSTSIKTKKKSYIHNVVLNSKKFGLWKFSQTEGNCTDETDKQPDSVNTFFNGKGYITYGKNNKLNPTKLTLGFDFNTFDENSLIYLASFDEATSNAKEYYFWKKGYLNLKIKHSNGVNTALKLDNKSNNGKRHHVEINMEYKSSGIQHYILFGKNETFEERKTATNTLNKKNVFKIKQSSHYIGGVPPIYNKTCLGINATSFLGFLQLTTPLSNEILSYGVLKTGKQFLEFYQAKINPNGHIKIKLAEDKVESVSFILQPTSPNGIIMNLHQYNVSLNNYKLKIDQLKDDYDIGLNRNEYNTVNISAKDGILTVNKNERIIQFPQTNVIKDFIVLIGDGQKGFSGGISNILINNKEFTFTPETVLEFSNVEIGRESPSSVSKSKEKAVKSLSTYSTNSMQNTEGCASAVNYAIDSDAVKFGDKSESYVHIKTDFWKSDYKMTLQIRTFHSNGMIFVSLGNQKQPNYNLLKLTEGKLGFFVRGRKNKSPIILKDKLNDGQWHKISITKRKRKLTIAVDQAPKKQFKIPKTTVRNEIFLGGLPRTSEYTNIEELGKLHPFRGCMKSVIINDEHQLIKNKDVSHSNTGQCFSDIEEGAYFDGDAFALFSEDFTLNKIPVLSLEFRTTEQNGILLSISGSKNKPAVSLELHNGAVVMSVDMRKEVVSSVTNNLGSDFALCNNMWHNVTTMYDYSSSELTVNVDGIKKIWVHSDINSLVDEISAPFYIGGLPDEAPTGSLKSKINFKGCIKNLKIENTLVDWSNIDELNNVVLNSCPQV